MTKGLFDAPLENPAPGQRVEICFEPDNPDMKWVPAVITRGPLLYEGVEYWEVEATSASGEKYTAARSVDEMRRA